jgi:hypothetical protein
LSYNRLQRTACDVVVCAARWRRLLCTLPARSRMNKALREHILRKEEALEDTLRLVLREELNAGGANNALQPAAFIDKHFCKRAESRMLANESCG